MKVDDDFLERLAKIAYVPTAGERRKEATVETRKDERRVEGKKKKSGEVPRSVSPKTEADGPPPLVEFEDIAEETTVLSEHAVKSKETESADVRVEVAKEKVAFWKTVHGLASEADRFFGIDGKKLSKRDEKYKIELDSASLEALMWLNM